MSRRHRLDRLERACRAQYLASLARLSITERAGRVCALLARVCRRVGRPREATRWTASAAQFQAGRDEPQVRAQAEQFLQAARLARQQHREAAP
jgi:hypothetical protein